MRYFLSIKSDTKINAVFCSFRILMTVLLPPTVRKLLFILVVALGCLLPFLGCHSSSQPEKKLLIATAANMQFAMAQLTQTFMQETGIACEVIPASSGRLTAQIVAGAPYDIFVSADLAYPATLFKNGYALDSPKTYAFGQLVVWFRKGQKPEPLHHLKLLLSPKRVALANPETAPYGKAAQQTLQALGLDSLWQGRLVYGESISQVNQFVSTGAADIGFTAKSAVLAANYKGTWRVIPDSLYSPIRQGAVMLKGGRAKREHARQFYDFLFSQQAKEILHKFGYSG